MAKEKNVPLVSIIIPLYNRAHTIKACIKSCSDQTYENVEIIVIDDASTDNSVRIVEELMIDDPRISLYKNAENMKLGFTRNVGIRNSKGELITFLDSDDLFETSKIETCVDAYLEDPDLECINSPVITRFYNRPDQRSTIVPEKDLVAEYLKREVIWKIIGPVWRRSFLEKNGWFLTGSEIFGSEDFEFHFRCILNQPKLRYLEVPLSVQVNLDPNIDKVKIRHADKFDSRTRQSIFARAWVLRRLIDSELSLKSKLPYYWIIFYYWMSLMKTSIRKTSLQKSISIFNYSLGLLFNLRRLKAVA